MSKVVLKGFILVPESELGLVKSELTNHKRLTLEEGGCITLQVTENPKILCVLMFMRSLLIGPLLTITKNESKLPAGE